MDDRTRRRILWLSLVVMAEAVQSVRDAPMRPEASLRLALAIAFSFSNGDRQPFDDFWREATSDGPSSWSETMSRSARTTHLMTQLRRVLRAVGIEPNNASELPLHKAARKSLKARADQRADAIRRLALR